MPRPGGYRSLAGLLCGYALLIIGNGLFQTLIPLRILQSGYSTVVVGLVQSCYYAGFIAGSFINRPLIDRIGQHRTFVAFSASVAILAIAFGFGHSPFALASIRLLSGFAFMGLYTSIESWINGAVENERRGQAFGTYAGINYLAVGTGQLLLNVGDSSGAQQLSLVAALFAAAVLPVTLMEGWPVRVADESLKRVPVKTWKTSIQQMMSATPLAVPGAGPHRTWAAGGQLGNATCPFFVWWHDRTTVASILMTLVGPHGLFLLNAISCALLAVCAKRSLRTTWRG